MDNTTTEQEQYHVTHHRGVTRAIGGLVLCPIDVAADDAVEVAPADDEPKSYASFVHPFQVVACP